MTTELHAKAMGTSSSQEDIRRLFEENAGIIYGLGLKTCRSATDAEDLVQETFMRAYKAWDDFEGRSNPRTWLYTIAVRACQRMQRLRSGEPSEKESFEELLPAHEGELVDVSAAGESDALDSIMREEVRESVEQAIATLPMPFRLALVLKEIAGFSLAQAAEVLGVKEATVKTRVHRARLMLRKVLAEDLPRRPAGEHDDESGPGHVCLDLLRLKQEALDRGVEFPVDAEEMCERCRSVFATLDLAHNACVDIGHGRYPESLQALIDRTLAS